MRAARLFLVFITISTSTGLIHNFLRALKDGSSVEKINYKDDSITGLLDTKAKAVHNLKASAYKFLSQKLRRLMEWKTPTTERTSTPCSVEDVEVTNDATKGSAIYSFNDILGSQGDLY